ncbi:MAG: MoxR-like ATPase [Myxococcota bacterium]|jgi:MoxR-like ATPase
MPVIGPPGTAKSAAVRRVSTALGGSYFEYLLGRFTEPSELFGTVDLNALRAGEVRLRTEGMLPEAEIAFLDEVFLGSTAILNTLLSVLNERRFRRGHTIIECPLRVCVAAANHLPDDPALDVFADRFLVRAFLEPLPDAALEELLVAGAGLQNSAVRAVADTQTLDRVAARARACDRSAVQGPLAHAVRLLRKDGIALSDRRVVKAQKLTAAAAAMDGRATADERDLWPLIYAIPTAEEQSWSPRTKTVPSTLMTCALRPHWTAHPRP